MTGLDVIAAKLITGKPLKILKAIKVVPHGIQPGLRPVKVRGEVEVDPLHDDLAVKFVELRDALKPTAPELAGGLKVMANSAAFGLFCQMNVKDLDARSPLHVFSGDTEYDTPPVKVWEEPAEFYSPVISSFVTGGSHLLCAMLDCLVRDMGGQIAAMDTDSAMITSTRDGGLGFLRGWTAQAGTVPRGEFERGNSRRCPGLKWIESVNDSKPSIRGAIRSKLHF